MGSHGAPGTGVVGGMASGCGVVHSPGTTSLGAVAPIDAAATAGPDCTPPNMPLVKAAKNAKCPSARNLVASNEDDCPCDAASNSESLYEVRVKRLKFYPLPGP